MLLDSIDYERFDLHVGRKLREQTAKRYNNAEFLRFVHSLSNIGQSYNFNDDINISLQTDHNIGNNRISLLALKFQ